jgi:polyisoprenyl-teichoic acid--peptidoglycan teichoic acid transferase
MTRVQKFTLGVLSVLACVLWLAVFYFIPQWYQGWSQQPLGPTLVVPTQLRLPTSSAGSTAVILPTLTAPVGVSFETQTPVPSSPFLSCNNNAPTMTVLALGTDVRPGQHRSGLTDFMRAVRVDFQNQRVTTLEFPRDLWVQLPGFTYNQKLNTAYSYGGPENGPGLLASTLRQNFGLNVDHYMVANMTLFAEVVDALGGLDIIIPPGGIDGRTNTDRSERLVFPEGLQHLSGEQALTLARLRNVSVFERAKNQNMVMCALRKKVESPDVVLKLPAIINSFMNNIQTDLTPDQISQMACLGVQMPRSNILFAGFPRELFHSGEAYDSALNQNVFIWDVSFDQLHRYVSDFEAGTWPSASPSSEPEAGTGTCE